MRKNYCIACKKEISLRATRCSKCFGKLNTGESSATFKHGLCSSKNRNKIYYCKICSKNKISLQSFLYGQKICLSCSKRGKKRPHLSKKYMGEGNPFKNKHHTKETKERVRKKVSGTNSPHYKHGSKSKCLDCGREIYYQNNRCQQCETLRRIKINFWSAKPNKVEKRLISILQRLFPNEYELNVKANVMILGGKVPDFVNVDGQKKIIELFGDYWHSKKRTGRAKKEEENKRINGFKKLGYKTLIIWEHELKDLDKVGLKILQFNEKEG